jgi:hypothetical protein
MIARFLEPAREELAEPAAFCELRLDGLGDQFIREVQRCVGIICERPMTWPIIYQNIRRYRIDRFPYGIIYGAEGSEISIIAIAHLHRKPKYWLKRLKQQE